MSRIVAQANLLPGAGQGASSTAEFYFKDSKGVNDAIVAIPVNQVLGGSTLGAGVSGAAGIQYTNSKKFIVRAGGYINAQAGTTPDFQFKIDAGNDAAVANNTTIADTGSIVLDNDTTRQTFYAEAELMLSPVSSKLQGEFTGWVNNTIIAQAAITESVEDLIAGGVLYFKATGQFSESIASQTAVLTFLQVLI